VSRCSRTASTSAGRSKRTSTTVPPVKSNASLKPLRMMLPSAAMNTSAAMPTAIHRVRMKSNLVSFGIRWSGNNFMVSILFPSDGQGLELLAAAVQQHRKGAGNGNGGEHRGEDADDHGHG